MEEKYISTFDDFIKAHPEIDPALKPFVEPAVQGA